MLDAILEERLIQLAEAQEIGDLRIHPIKRATFAGADILTLDEALAARLVEVSEISDGGFVPELRFRNRADKPVLLLDGEELQGGKQNRVLNLTILVGAKDEIVIPVSCVEQGRWSRARRGYHSVGTGAPLSEMQSSENVMFSSARLEKMRRVNLSMKERRAYRSDQSDIWDRIDEKARRLESVSETGAAAKIFDDHRARISELVRAFRFEGDEVGAVFVIRGRVAGIEIFGSSVLFAKLWPKLARSYAVDVLDRLHMPAEAAAPVEAGDPHAAIERLRRQKVDRYKALGLGDDVRSDGGELVAAGLVHEEDLVHLSAFVSA